MNAWRISLAAGLLVVSMLLVFGACSSDKQDQVGTVKATFAVDQQLLTPTPYSNSELDMQVQPPLQWSAADTIVQNMLRTSLQQNGFEELVLKSSYSDTSGTAYMLISDLSVMQGDKLVALRKGHNQLLNKDQQWQNIQYTQFMYGNYTVDQYLLQGEQIINFKLLFFDKFGHKALFGIDYFLPPGQMPQYIKAVESSIGSVKSLTLTL